jgi:(p)ppGpp synthase/HD superfamily hydrolase
MASIVEAVEHTPEMLAAAWLHDVVENTKTTVEDIRLLFGAAIANFVDQLTDVSRSFDGNRARRKALDRAHLAKASQEAQTIKLADLIDNSPRLWARFIMAQRGLVNGPCAPKSQYVIRIPIMC